MKKHEYVSHVTDSKGYVTWTKEENKTWETLLQRQTEVIQTRACKEFLKGLELLELPKNTIVQIPELNKILLNLTGWSIQAVPAIIGPKDFFSLLANKKFPAATFIRIPEHLDYLQEPDIFHEIFGHTPLLTHPAYCHFMEKFGKLALTVSGPDRKKLFRLFWFTIEFGLLEEGNLKEKKAYGGGILSSIGETQYCLSSTPIILPFDSLVALRTPYRIDIMQPLYFCLKNLEQLFSILEQDILGLLALAESMGDLPASFQKEEKIKEENEQC